MSPPPLDQAEQTALLEALASTGRAVALLERALDSLSGTSPLAELLTRRRRHLAALEALRARYLAAAVAPAPALAVESFGDARVACEVLLTEELASGERHQAWLDSTRRPDLLTVFQHLESTSSDHALPALRRALKRAGGDPSRLESRGAHRRAGRCG